MFNQAKPTVLHLDLNSCFAAIEQQANPLLRGKPVAVAAYAESAGCILAASYEAKRLGVTTGMRVFEGKKLCPDLVVLPSDPDKYRFINRQLLTLLRTYRAEIEVKSIDEMVAKFQEGDMLRIAKEIKQRIKNEIGEWLTVSIGISTNRYLAKVASTLHKPDGLDIISAQNIEHILCSLELEDLTGIKSGYGSRLRKSGIINPLMMYGASAKTLQRAFGSKIGHDWWLMLHGYESNRFDYEETKTIGHSYALKVPYATSDPKLHQILCQLVEKMGRRLRMYALLASGIHVSCLFADRTYWNHGEKIPRTLFVTRDLFAEALRVLKKAPDKSVRLLAVSCFSLTTSEQLSLLETPRKRLTFALDAIAERYGELTVFPARMLSTEQKVLDRIAFGGVRSLV